MPKIKVECGCGGSFEDTPSGKHKHLQTTKHNGWVMANASRAESKAKFDARKQPKAALENPSGESMLARAKAAKKAAQPVASDGPSATEAEEAKPDSTPETNPELPDASGWDAGAGSLTIAANAPFDGATVPGFAEAIAATIAAEASTQAAKEAVAKYKRYVRYGELHSPKNLPKYQQQLAEAEEQLALATGELDAAKEAESTAGVAAREANAAYWIRVHRATVAAIRPELPKGTPEITIESSFGGLTLAVGALPIFVIGPHMGVEDGEARVLTSKVMLKLDALVTPSLANQVSQLVWVAGRYASALDKVCGITK